MSVSLRVLIPEETTNYVLNPEFGIDTTGWTSVGSTLTRTLDRARFGIASCKVVTAGSVLREGIFYRARNLVGVSDNVSATIYVRGTGKVRLRLIDNPRGKEFRGDPVYLNDTRWQRLEVNGYISSTLIPPTSDDVRLYVETADNTAKAITFYVDGAQIERKTYATTYCDGFQSGCRWTGLSYGSTSTRTAEVARGGLDGGKWVALAGPCLPDKNVYITAVGGLGMPQIDISFQPFSAMPGSFVQGAKVGNRTIIFTFHAKKKNIYGGGKPDLTALHALRQQIIDIVKPDFARGAGIKFEYMENGFPVYFKARYDGGLEGEWDIRNEWVNSFPLRLLCVEPMLYEDDKEVTQLDFQDTISPGATKLTAVGRVENGWKKLSPTGNGPNDNILCMAVGRNGEIYAGGDFTAIDAIAGTSHIAYWNGTTWVSMKGGANGVVNCVTVAPDGSVWVGGNFSTIGGIAAGKIAKWDGTTWTAPFALNAPCYAVCVAPNGVLYFGGDFTTAGGKTVNRIARYVGGVVQTVGAGTAGVGATVLCITNHIDGQTLYVGGDFLNASGITDASYFAALDIVTNLFSATNNPVFTIGTSIKAIAVNSSGVAYVGGDMITSWAPVIPFHVAAYGGAGWFQMESDCDGTVYAIACSPNGYAYFGGDFKTIGGTFSRYLTYWNGFGFFSTDIVLNSPGTSRIKTIVIDERQDVYIGQYLTTPTNSYVAAETVIDNIGTASTGVSIYINGPGRLLYIENVTTRNKMLFNLDILQNEEVVIDTEAATIKSSFRENLFYGIVASSALGQFNINAGLNELRVLMINDTGAKMQLSYVPKHWSVDAVGDAESL